MSRLIDIRLDDRRSDGLTNNAFEGDSHAGSPSCSVPPAGTNGAAESLANDVEGQKRQTWSNPVEFLLSCISMSVGLGNIWRFPSVAFENGGGAFLIPYFLVLIFIGRPLYFLELLLGQFSSLGSVKLWNISPIARGVGYAQAISSYAIATYYTFLMAISVFYFFASFQETLPWALCPNATEATCYGANDNITVINATGMKSSSSFYFKNDVLHEVANLDGGLGLPDWKLVLCLLFCWIAILLTMIKGVASSGKVAYFTSLFPYVVLFTLLIRGVTLPGSVEGIKYFLNPQWEKLLDGKVWYKAVSQCFFSLGVGSGQIATLASYNPYRHNIFRDAVIISLADTFTSVLAGFTIFSVLGNLAHETGQHITAVVDGGTGLAFEAYPFAIARFRDVPQLFSALFFLMLFTLAIGSATPIVTNLVNIVTDAFPNFNRRLCTLVISITAFLLGLIYTTPGGMHVLGLVDTFSGEFIVFTAVIVQVLAISWIYGLGNFLRDVRHMLGFSVRVYWIFSWGFFIPLSLSTIFIYHMIGFENLPLPNQYLVCGWTLATFALLQFPLWAGYAIYKSSGLSWSERLKNSFKPSDKWGPADRNDRIDWETNRGEPVDFLRRGKLLCKLKKSGRQ